MLSSEFPQESKKGKSTPKDKHSNYREEKEIFLWECTPSPHSGCCTYH
jgi:hypothetical protein